MNSGLHFNITKPDPPLSDFVHSFTSLYNLATLTNGVIIPNGRVDLIFSKSDNNQFQIFLIGLETKPKIISNQNITDFFAISFNPLAIEYIFRESIADILDKGKLLPDNFWDFTLDDLNDFESFCRRASQKIQELLPKEIDERKRKLFELIFSVNGEISVQEVSEQIFWNPRQINRYFNQQFGMSLKSYCKILRFQASLAHIKAGELYPQLNFTDQSHFIKEVKKLSGVSPRELSQNENDRFLQFLATGKS